MKSFLFVSILFLQACSNLPANIKNAPNVNLQLHQVLTNSENFQNNPVRWGGTIIDVENESEGAKMQILFYPLNYFGRPLLSQPALGRFITVSKLFLDPAIFEKGTEITVAGSLQGTVDKTFGEKTITMPIIKIDGHHIWPKYKQPYYYNRPSYFHSGFGHGYYPNYSYRGRYRYNSCY